MLMPPSQIVVGVVISGEAALPLLGAVGAVHHLAAAHLAAAAAAAGAPPGRTAEAAHLHSAGRG